MSKKSILVAFATFIILTSSIGYASDQEGQKPIGKNINSTVVESTSIKNQFSLKGKSNSFEQVILTWEKDIKATGYIIYKYDKANGEYVAIQTINDPAHNTFIDENVSAGQTYNYQVTPILALVEKDNSEIVSVTVKKVLPKISAKNSGTTANVVWTKVNGAKEYQLYRSTNKDKGFKKVVTTTKLKLHENDLDKNTKYYYKVKATNEKKSTPISVATSIDTGEMNFNWPVPSNHYIASDFGKRTAPTAGASNNHQGIDISTAVGSDVLSVADGVVTEVSSNGARGIYVIVEHSDGLSTLYQHLSLSNVSVGENVSSGKKIAEVGNTGISSGPHLHFEVHLYGTPVDPEKYL